MLFSLIDLPNEIKIYQPAANNVFFSPLSCQHCNDVTIEQKNSKYSHLDQQDTLRKCADIKRLFFRC